MRRWATVMWRKHSNSCASQFRAAQRSRGGPAAKLPQPTRPGLLLLLPLDDVPLDLAQDGGVLGPVEVFDDRVRVRRCSTAPGAGRNRTGAASAIGRGNLRFDYPPDVSIVANHTWLNQDDGGGGNRTRVRSRTVKSLSKHSRPLDFASRPVGRRTYRLASRS
jgi:hypothetical protein